MAKKMISVYIDPELRDKIKPAFIAWATKKGGITREGTPYRQNDFLLEAISDKIAKMLDTSLDTSHENSEKTDNNGQ